MYIESMENKKLKAIDAFLKIYEIYIKEMDRLAFI
jgi:hypothetical protein